MYVKNKDIERFRSGMDRDLNYAFSPLSHRDVMVISDLMEDGAPLFSVNLKACGISLSSMKTLARGLARVPTLVRIDLSKNNFSEENLGFLAWGFRVNQNILFASPSCPELERRCQRNRFIARGLLQKMMYQPMALTKKDFSDIEKRLPAIAAWATLQQGLTHDRFGQVLLNVRDAAFGMGEKITYAEPFVHYLPDGSYPPKGMERVDFSRISNVSDLLEPVGNPAYYQAIQRGQLDDVMSFLKKNGRTLDARMCLMRPTDDDPSVIELITRQGRLAAIMTPQNWGGDIIGLRAVSEKIPPKALELQLRGRSFSALLTTVAATGFQKAVPPHRFRVQPRPN